MLCSRRSLELHHFTTLLLLGLEKVEKISTLHHLNISEYM